MKTHRVPLSKIQKAFGIIILTWLTVDAAHSAIAIKTVAAQAGIERQEVSSGWCYKLGRTTTTSQTIVIGEFTARPQVLYTISGQFEVKEIQNPESLSIGVRWLDSAGKDMGEVERALGQTDSTLRSNAKTTWSMTGPASRGEVKRGCLELIVPPLPVNAVIEVTNLVVSEGENTTKASDGSGITMGKPVKIADPSYKFSANILKSQGFSDWKYRGKGSPYTENEGYSGAPCLLLKEENVGGEWISPINPIEPGAALWISYWARFSSHARSGWKPSPVRIDFYKKDPDGNLIPVPYTKRLDLDGACQLTASYGQWLPIILGPIYPPAEATMIGLRAIYEKELVSWGSTPLVPNWGNLTLDSFSIWQGKEVAGSADEKLSIYGPFFTNAKKTLPPFVPVGGRRENSILLFPIRSANANISFVEETDVPTVAVQVGNLLPIARKISIQGTVLDWSGREIGKFKVDCELGPYADSEMKLPIGKPARFGSYSIDLEATESGVMCNQNSIRFAWLHRPKQTDEVRHDSRYPFDMHPTRLNADPEGIDDLEEIDFQVHLLRTMGVRGIRLQSRYYGLDLKSAENSVTGARKKVNDWRRTLLPAMKKYGIEGWVSFMEQGKGRVPRTPEEKQAWYQYNFEQVKEFGNDIQFALYGNEGLGGHTPDNPDESCWSRSSYDGTTREWMESYLLAYRAAKAANPQLPFGPSQASDPEALNVRRFYKLLGKEAKFDVFGYNAYGNSTKMGINIWNEIKAHNNKNAFCVIPEVGISVPAFGENRTQREKDQAIGLVETHLDVLSKTPWVKRIDWFILQGGRGEDSHFLFDYDWTPRSAAAAYLVLADVLGAGAVEKRMSWSGGTELIVWRRTNGTLVGVGWSQSQQAVTLDIGGDQIDIVDMFGNRTTQEASRNTVAVSLTNEPVYILGASKLDESKLLEIHASNTTQRRGDEQEISLRIKNNGEAESTLSIDASAHPTVTIVPKKRALKIKPGETATQTFSVCFLNRNDRLRVPVNFNVADANGITFPVKCADTFATCVKAPDGFRINRTWNGWERAEVLHADQRTQVNEIMNVPWKGPGDVSAEIMSMWDDKYYYFGVRVRDDVFHNRQTSQRLFLNDAIEIGFDFNHSLSSGATLWQLVIGRGSEGNAAYRFTPGSPGSVALEDKRLIIIPGKEGGNVLYQAAIPWSELGNFAPQPGKQIGFGVIIDDSDGNPNDRKFISWFGDGISSKQPQQLGDLIFVQ